MAYIEYNNVTFTYPEMTAPAVKELSLQVEKGQFIVLFGSSGSGKSTLLRLLKKEIQPNGTLLGDIFLDGKSLMEMRNESSRDVGFVFQDPENQLVAEEVLHELAFGLENIGLAKSEMRNRIAEMVHFMGAESMLHRKVHELSGGQKQQINLASVLLMQPKILLLDEPTAQLDPVSTREFLNMIVRLNEEFGLTVIMAEHRLDEVISYADKLVMMDKGEIVFNGPPKEVLTEIWQGQVRERPFIPAIPSFYFQVYDSLVGSVRWEDSKEGSLLYQTPPLTVKEGRNWLETVALKDEEYVLKTNPNSMYGNHVKGDELVQVNNLFFTMA
ncbi:MAG: energy-coupling factor ABC transporter ATP-binding protein [Bacillus sp. (in: Bacteria)]|nr:energy-coupling factor ABC transporter ATP-binding protein [Bacillus sp. (in: firmicutes)]